jgi:hypothetical protein
VAVNSAIIGSVTDQELLNRRQGRTQSIDTLASTPRNLPMADSHCRDRRAQGKFPGEIRIVESIVTVMPYFGGARPKLPHGRKRFTMATCLNVALG